MKIKPDTFILVAALGVGIYFLKGLFDKGTDKASSAIADAWVSLTSSAPITVAGNAVLPGNKLVPLSSMEIRSDTSGGGFTVYAKYAGIVYRLSPHDANGNYPASPT